jgi:hypothetical protein
MLWCGTDSWIRAGGWLFIGMAWDVEVVGFGGMGA